MFSLKDYQINFINSCNPRELYKIKLTKRTQYELIGTEKGQ